MKHHAAARAGAAAAHTAIGLLLAFWGHAHWPQAHAGLWPLTAWLALVAIWQSWQAQPLGPAPATDGARRAARWGMLPMMAGLPTLLDLCSSPAGGLWAVAAGHAAAMVLPPTLLGLRPARWWPGPSVWCAALLLLGGVAIGCWPGLQGLMLASCAHGAAFAVAVCAGPGAQPQRESRFDPWPALSVLGLGAALQAQGPAVLVLLHAALALCGLAWAAQRALELRLVQRVPAHG